MRSFDLYSEKSLRDTSVDSNAGRAFAREASDLEKRDHSSSRFDQLLGRGPTLTNNDKTGLACAGLIVGSPFFLLSIGGTFAMCDQADRMRSAGELGKLQEQELRAHGQRPAKPENSDLARLPEIMPFNDLTQFEICEPDAIKGKRTRKPGDRIPMHQVFFSDMLRNRSFLSRGKNWLQAEKILKLKKFLKDQIAALAKQQNYHTVCKLSAQVELLDKALKQLG